MGTDIHMRAEALYRSEDWDDETSEWKQQSEWRIVDALFPDKFWLHHKNNDGSESRYAWSVEPYRGRNYTLFAVLADVRNGSGFAGVDTGDPVPVIHDPRGVPEDSPLFTTYQDDWTLGDHSFSWATVEELDAYDWTHAQVVRGVVDGKTYAAMLSGEIDAPESWSGWISGDGIVVYDRTTGGPLIDNEKAHYSVQWERPIADACDDFMEYTMPRLRMLGPPDRVRIVYGFDS